MDGIIGDFFRLGRRLRPATQEFAVANFPRLIYRLHQNKLSITNEQSVGNTHLVQCWTALRNERWVILKSDFDICKYIQKKTALQVFPGDTEQIILSKIRAHVQVEFAGRGLPPVSSPGNVCY